MEEFETNRVFPVYLSFVRSSLIQTEDPDRFVRWMLARICAATVRALMKAGLLASLPASVKILAGSPDVSDAKPTLIEQVAEAYENSWKTPDAKIDTAILPTIDKMKEALEDISVDLNIKRFVLLIDEAAHIFLPEQQRQFFTLFRDLRAHCVTCNASVYPGVTSFGDTFQPAHDATMLSMDRNILADDYVETMREIVQKQGDSALQRNVLQNAKNFGILAYSASGNPRLLLKTIVSAEKINSSQINAVIKEYYRADIWTEHTSLADKYTGHRPIIDWGRRFIESTVLPDLKNKNDNYLSTDKKTSAYIWIHRDAPQIVKESLRILSYTGVLSEQASGMRASRSEVGTRYIVNLGCLFALEATPTTSSFEIGSSLTPKRMTEYGANHSAFKSLVDQANSLPQEKAENVLHRQLEKDISVLDLSDWQRKTLIDLKLVTVGDVLNASEEKLKEAYYVGEKRARRMKNAAVAAVLEYLSG